MPLPANSVAQGSAGRKWKRACLGTQDALGTISDAQERALKIDIHFPKKQGEIARTGLSESIRAMFQTCQLYDVYLIVGAHRFGAHQAVLASTGEGFRQRLRKALENPCYSGQCLEVSLQEISCPEAVTAVIDFVYELREDYHVSSDAAHRDVLCLAKAFGLEWLEEQVLIKLAEEISVDNAVERLAIFEEFGHAHLCEAILDKLFVCGSAFQTVSNSLEIKKYPKVMQRVLLWSLRAELQERPPTPPRVAKKPLLPPPKAMPQVAVSSGKRSRAKASKK